ncbi:MAG TPA: hypothetical protein VGG99_09205 [Acetobacteraceae bacterium]|jgi:hypothetical protein
MRDPTIPTRPVERAFEGVHVGRGRYMLGVVVVDGIVRTIDRMADGRHPILSCRARHDAAMCG